MQLYNILNPRWHELRYVESPFFFYIKDYICLIETEFNFMLNLMRGDIKLTVNGIF